MPITWISVNKRLLEASSLINDIPLESFTNILDLLISKETVAIDDLAEINKAIHYSDEQLLLLVQSILHIYKKSSLIILKPLKLQRDLEESLKLNADKAKAFVKIWTTATNKEFGDLDKRKKVDHVTWSLHLKTHSSKNLPGIITPQPSGTLQLALSDLDNNKNEKATLNMTPNELEHLYKVLELIQGKIDNINTLKT